MATLPTLTVTTEQADRLLAVFGSPDRYKEWLKQTVIAYVISQEVEQQIQVVRDTKQVEQNNLLSNIST